MLAVEFSGLNPSFQICVVVGYASNKRDGEERDMFWNDMDSVGIDYRLCILEDLNRWKGDRT